MREHRRTPKKRKSGGGTRGKRYRGGATPADPSSVESVAVGNTPIVKPSDTRLQIFENIAPSDTPPVQEPYIPQTQYDTIDLYIEKEPTVTIRVNKQDGTEPNTYIKFIKCINSNALDKLSKIMYSTLLNKGDEEVHLLIQDSLCLYKQHKSEIENKIIGNLKTLEGDVKYLKDNIDKYSREYDVVKFHKDIMSIDDKYFVDDKDDFKGMFVNIRNEFDNGIIGFRGNEVSRKIFQKEEKGMKGRSQFERNKFYLFNIIDFMIFMGIKVREELEEYLEAINKLVQFNNDIIKLQKKIKKEEEIANKKNENTMTLRELFKDEQDPGIKRKNEFILNKVENQMNVNGSSVLVDLKSLMDEKKVKGVDNEEITRIEKEINDKKSELMKEISKFKFEDNADITGHLEKGIVLMDESKVEKEDDKKEAKDVKELLQKLLNEKKKLEEISKKQKGGSAQAVPVSYDPEIQKINETIKEITNELDEMKKEREKKMKGQNESWTWKDDPLFLYYYYTSMGNVLGNLLSYQIYFWNTLKLSIDTSLGDLSNTDIGVFFKNIVNGVGEDVGDGLTNAAIASQDLVTGILWGSFELLGKAFNVVADGIGDFADSLRAVYNAAADNVVGAADNVVGATVEGSRSSFSEDMSELFLGFIFGW